MGETSWLVDGGYVVGHNLQQSIRFKPEKLYMRRIAVSTCTYRKPRSWRSAHAQTNTALNHTYYPGCAYRATLKLCADALADGEERNFHV